MQTCEDRVTAETGERRRWPRHPSRLVEVTIWTGPATSQKATVLDESLTGIGLLVEDMSTLATEKEIRVDYDGRPIRAIIRNLRPGREGKHRVGLEWGHHELRPLSLAEVSSGY